MCICVCVCVQLGKKGEPWVSSEGGWVEVVCVRGGGGRSGGGPWVSSEAEPSKLLLARLARKSQDVGHAAHHFTLRTLGHQARPPSLPLSPLCPGLPTSQSPHSSAPAISPPSLPVPVSSQAFWFLLHPTINKLTCLALSFR